MTPYLNNGLVLDFGCGVGSLAALVPPDCYTGVDADASSIAQARAEHPKHAFCTVGEFERECSSRKFDTIVALALIEHLPEPERWLLQMSERLAPNGKLILTTPHPRLRWAHEFGASIGVFSREAAEEHAEMFDKGRLKAIAQPANLVVQTYRRFLLGCNQLFILGAS